MDAVSDGQQGSGRILHEHEYEPSDSGVEEALGMNRAGVALAEHDVDGPPRAAAFVGQANCVGVEIYADDGAVGAHEVAHEEAHVTHTAADVEHVHASADSGGPEQAFRKRPD